MKTLSNPQQFTELEKIYFNDDLSPIERVKQMAEYLHEKGDIHQQLYFAIQELEEG